mmetsp:Transcript_33377/g.96419  ORF Transcript_33377/g.96419 Transcript_33377/m.96419 type:complete len:203 (-) Transcript_33377:309-917(-)
MRFKRRFWQPTVRFFNTTQEAFQFMNLHAFDPDHCRNILVAHSFGAYKWDGKSDQQVLDEVMGVLRAMFTRSRCGEAGETAGERIAKTIEPPIQWVVTRWDTDPFSLGSYAFWKKGGRALEDNVALSSPEPFSHDNSQRSKVFFAGEATSAFGAQCVHGAAHSGVRAASEVVASVFNMTHLHPTWAGDDSDEVMEWRDKLLD